MDRMDPKQYYKLYSFPCRQSLSVCWWSI